MELRSSDVGSVSITIIQVNISTNQRLGIAEFSHAVKLDDKERIMRVNMELQLFIVFPHLHSPTCHFDSTSSKSKPT